MAHERIVVVGASSGGVTALQSLAAQLGPGFPVPVLAVQHIGSHRSILPDLLAARTGVPASHAAEGEPVRAGHIHVAPPDRHMILDGERIRLSHGPKENHTRPAIDPLFRSAALSRGADVIGVLLTGSLDDGTAGLQAIGKRGGTVVVQDPIDAESSSMPSSAIRYARVDHVVSLASMGELLHRLARERPLVTGPAPRLDELVKENDIAFGKGKAMEKLRAIGHPSTFACPECHGTLWQIDSGEPKRFRCHTGHAFTLRSLQHAQATGTDDAMWSAFRALQEKEALLRELADAAGGGENSRLLAEAQVVAGHAHTLRALIERMPTPLE